MHGIPIYWSQDLLFPIKQKFAEESQILFYALVWRNNVFFNVRSNAISFVDI